MQHVTRYQARTLSATLLLNALPQAAVAATVTEHVFQFPDGGPDRTYLIYQPDSYCPGHPAVLALHGGGQSMRIFLDESSPQALWTQLADEYGFLLIAPNGFREARPPTPTSPGEPASGLTMTQSWNDLRPPDGTLISMQDDSGFIAEIVRRAREDHAFDHRALFVTGSSNGGMMTYRMLIERADLFAGGCAFIANLPEDEIPDPIVPRPLMIMNGDADPLMPWIGGPVGAGAAPVRSAPATLAYWLGAHGLSGDTRIATTLPNNEPVDLTQIRRFEYPAANGVSMSPVVFYRVVNGGHAIPVLPGDPGALGGSQSLDTRGVNRAWDFFQTHLPPACAQDLNADGAVDAADLALLLGAWGDTAGCSDATDDGAADAVDIAQLLGAWGACP